MGLKHRAVPRPPSSGECPPSTPSAPYQVYGLQVRSEILLPELIPASPSPPSAPSAGVGAGGASGRAPGGTATPGGPTVTVVRAQLPPFPAGSAPGGWFCLADDGAFFLRIPGVARYRVTSSAAPGGEGGATDARVEVDPDPDADPAAVRVYLLGSAFGAVLYRVGALPLHVSAVGVEGRGWTFTAPSGTGKSTLAAALHLEAGLPFLADDVAAVHPLRERPEDPLPLHPGPPLLKLTHRVARSFRRLRHRALPPEGPDPDKVRIPLSAAPHPPLPLHAIVLLSRGQTDTPRLTLTPLSGPICVPALDAALYRREFASLLLPPELRLRLLAQLAGRVKVFLGTVPDSPLPRQGPPLRWPRRYGQDARQELERWGHGLLRGA